MGCPALWPLAESRYAEANTMTTVLAFNQASWFSRLSRMVRLTTIMAFPFQALEPELYRKVRAAEED